MTDFEKAVKEANEIYREFARIASMFNVSHRSISRPVSF